MYETNVFKEIKYYLKPQQVAEYYIVEHGKKSGSNVFYKSPFRTEKTASFCVNNEKGFHDYGSGWHGDVISFVAELYHLTPLESAKLLIKDFSLPIQLNKKINYKEVKEHKKKTVIKSKVQDGLNNWYNKTYLHLCDESKANDKVIEIICQNTEDKEKLFDALQYLYNKQFMLEMWINRFSEAQKDEEKLQLFRERDEIEKVWN